LAGVLLGNLNLVGLSGLDYLKTDLGIEILSSLGVILLLFEVGLDSSLADLLKVGLSSFLVATVGVVVPFGLGWLVSALLLSEQSAYVHAFIGATTLCEDEKSQCQALERTQPVLPMGLGYVASNSGLP
jgi:Kef-type K+ transport system membrane component KefB